MPSPLLANMIRRLGRLPGLGPRSGKRAALMLLKNKERLLKPLLRIMQEACDKVHPCSTCGYFDEQDPCFFCKDERRDPHALCVVSDAGDVWSIENTNIFRGRYHVLGGNLSMLEGIGPKDLRIDTLLQRFRTQNIKEVILALSPTIDGTTTTHFIVQEFQKAALHPHLTILAKGIPVGGDLEFIDESTLSTALQKRHSL